MMLLYCPGNGVHFYWILTRAKTKENLKKRSSRKEKKGRKSRTEHHNMYEQCTHNVSYVQWKIRSLDERPLCSSKRNT